MGGGLTIQPMKQIKAIKHVKNIIVVGLTPAEEGTVS